MHSQNHYLLFLTGLWQRPFFSDRWKVLIVTPTFKKGRRNNVEDHRGVAILYAILKRFELLVKKNVQRLEESNVYQSTKLHEESIDDNEPIGVCIFRAEFI
jgi:hypothetical protein